MPRYCLQISFRPRMFCAACFLVNNLSDILSCYCGLAIWSWILWWDPRSNRRSNRRYNSPYFHNNPACVPPVHDNFYHASPHQADCPAWLSKGRDCQGWPCLVGPGGAILCCGAHSLSTEMIILIVLLTFLCWLLIPATPPCHLLPVL